MRGAMYALLVPGWLLTVASMRTFQTSFVHHASHGMFLKPIKLGTRVAELLSVLIWIQPLSLYKADHLLHHSQTATLKDADLRFLVSLGFRPGLSIDRYWKMFFGMLLSPQFHLTYALYRLRANFVAAPFLRKLAAVLWTLALVVLSILGGWTWELLLVWMVPAWPLYQMSGLTQLLTEHNWVRIGDGKERVTVVLGRLTHARFFGEAVPEPGAGYVAWLAWFLRMLLIHFPQRLLVAQADLTNHDFHHRVSHGDWSNSAYARRDDALKPSSQWPEYTERWGFCAAASDTFRLLSSLPQNAVLGEPLTYGDRNDGFAGM